MSIIAIVLVPYVLLAATYFALFRAACRSSSSARLPLIFPATCSLITTLGFTAWGFSSIISSKSSTAAIGFLFLPFTSIGVAFTAYAVSWSLLYLARFFLVRSSPIESGSAKSRLLVGVAISILSLTGFTSWNWAARHKLLSSAASASIGTAELEPILDSAIASHDLDVLSKLAKNPTTSTKELLLIYDSCKDKLSDFNPLEYTVFYSLAQNPHTPADKLNILAKCRQSTVRLAVGMNPSTPMDTLQQLATDNDAQVRTWLTSNPNVPKDILVKLAEDPDKIVRSYATANMSRRGVGARP